MSRYINADALEQHKFVSWTMPEFFNERSLEQQAYQLGWNNAIEAIMENEPTADVVEVVRCEECRYWDNRFDVMVCNLTDGMKGASDYCSYGERREDERLNKQTGCD